MKGSDKIEMTINIGGELIKLDVDFDDQINVRDTERDIKSMLDRMKKNWPENTDRNILAMALYQYARWFNQLKDFQQEAIDIVQNKSEQIMAVINPSSLNETL